MNRVTASGQSGMVIIEVLIAILIFSLGILGMVGINALAVSSQSDAQYRSDANKFATDIINKMWVSVDRTTTTTLSDSLVAFKHQTGGASCAFSGATSGSTVVSQWVDSVLAAGTGLPGATNAMQQIDVAETASGGINEVTVTLCWQAPTDNATRKHVMKAVIN